jgi:predicted peptidase
MKSRLLIVINILVISLISYTNLICSDFPIGQSPQKVFIGREGIDYLGYLLFLPYTYYHDQTKNWPLILFLHGMGERGSDIELVKNAGIPKLLEKEANFPFVVVSPQCPENRYCIPTIIKQLLVNVSTELRVDSNKIYLTGLSMGGYGTWFTALEYPDLFAAIAPICGGGDPFRACSLRDLQVWAFHGAKDTTVSPDESKNMADSIKKCGGNVKFTLYPELEHDCWTVTYENAELYNWFLEQSLMNRKR